MRRSVRLARSSLVAVLFLVAGRFRPCARAQAHQDGTAVATALLCQLADEMAKDGIKLLVVAQADERMEPEERARAETVIAALHRHRVLVLDLLTPLAAMKDKEPARFKSYFHDHMTDLGNRYVAEQIAQALKNPETAQRLPSPASAGEGDSRSSR